MNSVRPASASVRAAKFRTALGVPLSLALAMMTLSGCEPPPLDYTEVKRIHEPLDKGDIERFLSIVERLPGKVLPPMENVMSPPPDWSITRTLPVCDLALEEEGHLEERWKSEERGAGREGKKRRQPHY